MFSSGDDRGITAIMNQEQSQPPSIHTSTNLLRLLLHNFLHLFLLFADYYFIQPYFSEQLLQQQEQKS